MFIRLQFSAVSQCVFAIPLFIWTDKVYIMNPKQERGERVTRAVFSSSFVLHVSFLSENHPGKNWKPAR